MPEEILVRYRWTLAELTTASRWHLRQMPRVSGVHFVCWGLAGACGVLAVLAYRRSDNFYLVGWLLLGAIYFLGLLSFRRWLTLRRMRRNHARSTGQDAEIEWCVGENKLRIKTPHGSSEINWTAFNKAVQTTDGVLLYSQPIVFHWLPKAGFVSEAEYEQVARWVYGNVPNFRHIT